MTLPYRPAAEEQAGLALHAANPVQAACQGLQGLWKKERGQQLVVSSGCGRQRAVPPTAAVAASPAKRQQGCRLAQLARRHAAAALLTMILNEVNDGMRPLVASTSPVKYLCGQHQGLRWQLPSVKPPLMYAK